MVSALGRAVRGQPVQRVVWRGDGRLHLAVRGVTQERNAGLARAVEAELATNLILNSHLAAAGVVAVNRAQEYGYSFMYAG